MFWLFDFPWKSVLYINSKGNLVKEPPIVNSQQGIGNICIPVIILIIFNININTIFIINVNFIWFGNPKYPSFFFLNIFQNSDLPLFRKVCFLFKTIFVCLMFWLCLFLKTPDRRETQFHAGRWSNFVLKSHLDPIGDRNDV